jgi:hypothetical protein
MAAILTIGLSILSFVLGLIFSWIETRRPNEPDMGLVRCVFVTVGLVALGYALLGRSGFMLVPIGLTGITMIVAGARRWWWWER